MFHIDYLSIIANEARVVFRAKNKPGDASSDVYLGENNTNSLITLIKSLGVHFSEIVTWVTHIDYLCAMLGKTAGRVNNERYWLLTNVKSVFTM